MKVGDYVRIRDLAGKPHLARVTRISNGDKYVLVRLLTGMATARIPNKVEKLTDGEAMMLKLLENA